MCDLRAVVITVVVAAASLHGLHRLGGVVLWLLLLCWYWCRWCDVTEDVGVAAVCSTDCVLMQVLMMFVCVST